MHRELLEEMLESTYWKPRVLILRQHEYVDCSRFKRALVLARLCKRRLYLLQHSTQMFNRVVGPKQRVRMVFCVSPA